MHEEPWAFVVIQDPAALKRYSDVAKGNWAEAAHHRELHRGADAAAASAFAERFASPDFCVFYDAQTLIAICAKHGRPFAAADCWLAAENLMLAACAIGLGTCCIGSAIPALNSPAIKRVLNQAANAAVKAKGTIFAIVYRRLVPRLGHSQTIGAIAHRLCRLIWRLLHQRIRYEERGPAVNEQSKQARARKMIRELRSLGYRVERLEPSGSLA